MKKALCMALVGSLVCAVSASAQTEVTYTLVLEEDGLSYRIEAEITGGDACEGLGLVGTDVVGFANVPAQMTNPGGDMAGFEVNDGLNNPAGYGGTISGTSLLQVGGGQNTIDNDTGYAPYPIGTVVTGIGNSGPVIVATNGVCEADDVIEMANCFANVLDDTGPDVFAVSAATLTCTGSITCGLPGVTMQYAESGANHGASGYFATSIDLVATGCATLPAGATPDGRAFSATARQILNIEFDAPPTALAADGKVAITRCSDSSVWNVPGINMTVNGNWLEIDVNPVLADQHAYDVVLSATDVTGDNDFQFVLVSGNTVIFPPFTRYTVLAGDVSSTQGKFNATVDALNFQFDVVRFPPFTAGFILAGDISYVQGKFNNTVTLPCCP